MGRGSAGGGSALTLATPGPPVPLAEAFRQRRILGGPAA